MCDDSNKSLRLLLSARDPAAAHAIKNLLEWISQDTRFSVCVIASSPATQILVGLTCKCIFLSVKESSTLKLLESAVRKVIVDFKPDAIIAGSSGPDAGIDEVLIKYSGEIRSYIIQDFWGDVNLSLNASADCYFVVDSLAAELTQKRVSSEVYEVGSVKHAAYGHLNFSELRAAGRTGLSISKNSTVIGYFGMPLGEFDGYWRTLETLVASIDGLPVSVLYRPHPKESESDIYRTSNILRSISEFTLDISSNVESALASCDLVVSCYSSCGVDSELLGRNVENDDRLSIFLLYDDDIYNHYMHYTKLTDMPTSIQKRTLTIMSHTEIRSTLKTYLSRENRLRFLESSITPPLSGGSIKRVLDKVLEDYSVKYLSLRGTSK